MAFPSWLASAPSDEHLQQAQENQPTATHPIPAKARPKSSTLLTTPKRFNRSNPGFFGVPTVASGRRRLQALEMPFFGQKPPLRAPRICTAACDPSTHICNYEANPRYCTFANSWSTPCREHSTCLYLCTVLLLRLVYET